MECGESATKQKIHLYLLKYVTWTNCFISENSRKLHIADRANDVHCNFPPEALMNTVSSYEATYWLERISYSFLICNYFHQLFCICKEHDFIGLSFERPYLMTGVKVMSIFLSMFLVKTAEFNGICGSDFDEIHIEICGFRNPI